MSTTISINEQPSAYWAAITPHDSNALAQHQGKDVRAIYVGAGGNITCINYNGTTVLFTAVPTGTILPIRPRIVKSTGTAASALIGLY